MNEIKCLLKRINGLYFRRFNEISVKYELTGKQLMLLNFIERNSINSSGEISQKIIEKEFAIRRSSVTSILNTLEKHGLIIRAYDEQDNRKKSVKLTDNAINIITAAKVEMNLIEQHLSQSLSENEQNVLVKLLTKVYENMKNIIKE